MINKVILVGNVGADPEIKSFEGGVKMARIRLATTERVFIKEKNEYKENTEWHSITLWRTLADVVDKYVRKGAQLYIEGKLRTREYDKNGVKCFATEIVGETLKMLGKRDAQSQVASEPQVQRQQPTSVEDYPMPPLPEGVDDLPF